MKSENGKINFVKNDTQNKISISLLAVGDLIFDRQVSKIIKQNGPTYPYQNIRAVLKNSDILFANLEAPVSYNRSNPLPNKRINFCSIPEGLEGLRGFPSVILNLANNHTMDYGMEALNDTLEYVGQKNFHHIGAGNNLSDARTPALYRTEGFTIAFLGYASLDEETNATQSSPGTAPLIENLIIEDIQKAKTIADIVIVSMHKGREFVFYPEPEYQKLCRNLISAGADLILGHHPHVPQGIEKYNNGVIAYSIGLFLFDYEPPFSKFENRLFENTKRNNVMFQFSISKKGVNSVEIIPIQLTDRFQIEFLTGEDRKKYIEFIEKISVPLNQPEINTIFWKECKNYLGIQFPGYFIAIRKKGIRPMIIMFRWMLQDSTTRMIWGFLFKCNLPEFLLSIKNGILNTVKNLFRLLIRKKVAAKDVKETAGNSMSL